MRYIHFWGNAGFAGTDYHEFQVLDNDTEDTVIDDMSEEYCRSNAESYAYCATGWDGDFESEEDEEAYFGDALSNSGWTEVSAEEYVELLRWYA